MKHSGVKKRILLVEDEKLIALEIISRLEKLGYDICKNAINTKEALDELKKGCPDLVLMDIKIDGDTDGIETAKMIQSYKKIPIIFLTAYSDKEILERVKEINPYGYLTKPVQEKELRISLEMAFNRIEIEERLDKATRELAQSEKKYRLIAENSSDVIYVFNFEPCPHFEYISPSIGAMLGYDPGEFYVNPDLYNKLIVNKKHLSRFWKYLFSNHSINQSVELQLKTKDGHVVWVDQLINKKFDQNGNLSSFQATVRNITLNKISQLKLEYQSNLRKILTKLSSGFINVPLSQFDISLNSALGIIGRFVKVDRVYIFCYDFDNGTCSNTHEWCATGIEPQKENLQNIPVGEIKEWVNSHKQGKAIYIPDVSKMDEGLAKDILHAQKIKSLLTLPLTRTQGEIIGFIGFDSVKEFRYFGNDEQELLVMFGQVVLNFHLRREYEIKLYESEERFRSLYENATIGIYRTDENGRFLLANPTLVKLLGYGSLNELIQSDMQNTGFFKISSERIQLRKIIIKEGVITSHESALIKKDNSTIFIRESAKVIKNNTGKILFFEGTIEDITKERIAKLELTKERDLFSQGPVITTVWYPEPEWPVKYVSPNVKKILGYSQKEWLLKEFKYLSIIHPDDIDRVKKIADENISAHNDTYEVSYRIRKKNGTYLWFYDFAKLERDETGSLTEIRGYMFDQTQLKNAITKLEESELKYKTVADYTSGWEYWRDQQNRYRYISPYVSEITGYSHDDFLENKDLLEKIIYPDDLNKWKVHNKNLKCTKSPKLIPDIEFRIIDKNGNVRWIAHSSRKIFDSSGKYLGIRASNRDITFKHEAERNLIINTLKTEENERLRFSRELHDGLGPLLSTVKMYYQWILENDTKDKKEFIAGKGLFYIEEAIKTLREVSQNLSPLLLKNKGFYEAIRNFASDINETGKIRIIIQFTGKIKLEPLVEIVLYRILTELINNTIKYAGANEIEISLSTNKRRNNIRIVYQDDGVGFDLNKVEEKKKSTGLQNIKSRINSMNGIIDIITGMGQGTRVIISLPLELNI